MRWLAVIAGLALAVPALAYTSPGHATGYVNDFAHVLSPAVVQTLESDLKAFDASTSNQIAVVTVPSMSGDYIENYAQALFKEWGIGTKQHDNGVLLLLSIQERKIRIEVGYGLEGALPDSVAQSIISNMSPRLKAGDYDGAVTASVISIEQATKGEYQSAGTMSNADTINQWSTIAIFILIFLQWCAAVMARSKSIWAGGLVGGFVGVILSSLLGLWVIWGVGATVGLVMFGLLFDFLVSGAYNRSKSLGVGIPWWAGGGSHGSGFGGFGGGSSGGGGASGGW